eukprot:Em0019g531a
MTTQFLTKVSLQADSGAAKAENVSFTVTEVPRLNLLGRDAIIRLGVNIPALLRVSTAKGVDGNKELGCLKDVMLEIKFKTDASPVFCKPRVVPFAIQDDLVQAFEAGITKESQKRLALSTHRGVLLQRRLPFGISSAPAHFQEIMDQLTSDLKGVAIYVDDILASVEYLGYTLSSNGIAKGSKVDAVQLMPAPSDISSLRSFLGSVQFYGKFLPDLATVAEPLYRLTKKGGVGVTWSRLPSRSSRTC